MKEKEEKVMPESGFEIIGVEKAKLYLEKNHHNRPMNDRNLQALVFQMKNDTFENTGDPIRFDINGSLIDGQHRLMAIVKSGKTQEMLVVRKLAIEAFRHIDTGRKRQASDVLGIEGITNPTKIAAIAKFVIMFGRGKYGQIHSSQSNINLTNNDIADFVLANKLSLYESYKAGYNKYNKIISGSLLASFHYIFKQINEDQADDFCHKLGKGEELKEKDPIFVLRNHLLNDLRNRRKMPTLQKYAYICKAWNLYRTKKTITVFRYEPSTDPFPKPM